MILQFIAEYLLTAITCIELDYLPLQLSSNPSIGIAGYEHVLTMGYEQSIVWRSKWKGSTWIFVVNRYILLFSAIEQLLPVPADVSANRSSSYSKLTDM